MSSSISTYSIKDLERLTGIKAHTIRIWEQRYDLFKAERTKTNIRYYSNEDLIFIINISLLNQSGIKISKIALMSKADIQKTVLELNKNGSNLDLIITRLNIALLDFNETDFLSILEMQIQQIGFERTIIEVCFPLLKNIGILWLTNSLEPAQEHFASNLICQKIIAEIDKIGGGNNSKKPLFLIANVEKEYHDIGLLFSSYLVKKNGFNVVYLGKNVPISNILDFIEHKNPNYFISIFTSYPESEKIDDFIQAVQLKNKEIKMLFSGLQLQKRKNKKQKNVFCFFNLNDFQSFINEI